MKKLINSIVLIMTIIVFSISSFAETIIEVEDIEYILEPMEELSIECIDILDLNENVDNDIITDSEGVYSDSTQKNAKAKITLNITKAYIAVGETIQLKVKGTKVKATWSSSKSDVATVSKNGKVLAKKEGKTNIKAMVGTTKLTCKIIVQRAELNKAEAKLAIGDNVQLKVSGTKSKINWSSSNNNVAKVDKKGKVTGINEGKARITAKIGKIKLTCMVTVYEPIIGDISWIIFKDFETIRNRFIDEFRLFDDGYPNDGIDYYTNDYILLEVFTLNDNQVTSISLLTDAKEGIGKYTLFGIYPGIPISRAEEILKNEGYVGDDLYNNYYAKSGEIMYEKYNHVLLTVENDCVDLVSYFDNWR